MLAYVDMIVAIIGGGAAGLMTAATLTNLDPLIEVVLIERNDSLGKKVIISGGGRCNVTTGYDDVREILKKYPRGGKFLTSAMYAFPPSSVRQWFEERDVPLYCQDDMRVFPKSDDGKDIVGVFEDLFRKSDVKVWRNASVTDIAKDTDGRFVLHFKDDRPALTADKVVLTTGGQAYRHTGSTGDGYAFALSLGHTLTPLGPGLTALTTTEPWPAEVSGRSFAHARISSTKDKTYTFTGPFIFTHKGISGPATFAFSSLIAFETLSPTHSLPVTVDLFPTEKEDALQTRISTAMQEHPARTFVHILDEIIPRSLVALCAQELDIDRATRSDQTPKKDVTSAVRWMKAIPLTINGRVGGDEFVTAGGIPTTEIDPRTMESNICPGLYFAGEIMDVDGFTGGFNLQASWAAGHLVGMSIVDAAS